jgi:hypothetical protein
VVQPTIYQIAPHLKSPTLPRSPIGVDQQVTKAATISLTYLNSRGVHALDTSNINAPLYGGNTDNSGLRPLGTNENLYQYESAGVFKQNQLLVNFNLRAGKRLAIALRLLRARHVNSDTGGVNDLPFAAIRPQRRLRARHLRRSPAALLRRQLPDSEMGIRISPFMLAFSGPPFNITTSQDINGDSIFNDRPILCAAAGETGPGYLSDQVRQFQYKPRARAKPAIPINYGNAPGQFNLNLRVSKTFGIGPKVEGNGVGPVADLPVAEAAVVEAAVPDLSASAVAEVDLPVRAARRVRRYNLTLQRPGPQPLQQRELCGSYRRSRTDLRQLYGPRWRLRRSLAVRESPHRSASRLQLLNDRRQGWRLAGLPSNPSEESTLYFPVSVQRKAISSA